MSKSRTEPEDLWKIYKAVKQRFNRTKDIGQKLLAEKAMLAMKEVLQNTVIQNALLFSEYEQSYIDYMAPPVGLKPPTSCCIRIASILDQFSPDSINIWQLWFTIHSQFTI